MHISGARMEAKDKLRSLREEVGMTRKEFCDYFEIPYMTVTDWERGNRRVPMYLLRLIEYKIRMEDMMKKSNYPKEDENPK